MKKWLAVVGVCIAIAGAVMAWYPRPDPPEIVESPKSLLKPGEYRAEYDQPDSHGWKAFVVMEVNDQGEIAEVTFDYLSADGTTLKTQDAAYNKQMKAVNGLGPINYCPRFSKNLIIYQDPDQVDAITGATSSYRGFKELVRAAVASSQAGSREIVYLPQAVDH